jgi:hypothetical protein
VAFLATNGHATCDPKIPQDPALFELIRQQSIFNGGSVSSSDHIKLRG